MINTLDDLLEAEYGGRGLSDLTYRELYFLNRLYKHGFAAPDSLPAAWQRSMDAERVAMAVEVKEMELTPIEDIEKLIRSNQTTKRRRFAWFFA